MGKKTVRFSDVVQQRIVTPRLPSCDYAEKFPNYHDSEQGIASIWSRHPPPGFEYTSQEDLEDNVSRNEDVLNEYLHDDGRELPPCSQTQSNLEMVEDNNDRNSSDLYATSLDNNSYLQSFIPHALHANQSFNHDSRDQTYSWYYPYQEASASSDICSTCDPLDCSSTTAQVSDICQDDEDRKSYGTDETLCEEKSLQEREQTGSKTMPSAMERIFSNRRYTPLGAPGYHCEASNSRGTEEDEDRLKVGVGSEDERDRIRRELRRVDGCEASDTFGELVEWLSGKKCVGILVVIFCVILVVIVACIWTLVRRGLEW